MKKNKLERDHFIRMMVFLRKHVSLPIKNAAIAVSGGSDSIHLAKILLSDKLSKIIDISSVKIVHINHNWRGEESKLDEKFVQDFGKKLGVQVDVYNVYPNKNGKESPELQARNQRKEIFSKYDFVFTGHTEDDLFETILWKTLQGRDPGVGIKVVHGNEIRPSLVFSKEEIKNCLNSINQEWKEDKTNHDGKLLRSKMRKDLLPTLTRVFPESKRAIINSSLDKQNKKVG